jgi:2-polyprenyl-3-methyl-5-hydroxy-6-metoxy-1,4-benzoquinol methylase
VSRETGREILVRRVRYLATVIARRATCPNKACPYCGHRVTRIVGRKFGILQVRRCSECGLMFRWPKDSERFNRRYYQQRYSEPTASVLPTDAQLTVERARGFAGSVWDQRAKIARLQQAKPAPARMLEFGCSWGYGCFQLQSVGYDTTGFEISRPRAEFASKRLGVKIISDYAELDSIQAHSFDAIYTSHVLEHLPNLVGVFERFARLLRPDGVLMIFVPNCGDGSGRLRDGWKPIVNEMHSMAFDSVFFRNVLSRYGFEGDVQIGPGEEIIALARPSSGRSNPERSRTLATSVDDLAGTRR